MRRTHSLVVVALVAAMVGIVASLASAAPVAQSTTIATFSDSVGEQAGAPDISTVTVSLDGAVLTVEAQVADMPELMSEGGLMFLLNTDNNRATGEYVGADYVLFTDLGSMESAVLRWNGSDYVAGREGCRSFSDLDRRRRRRLHVQPGELRVAHAHRVLDERLQGFARERPA